MSFNPLSFLKKLFKKIMNVLKKIFKFIMDKLGIIGVLLIAIAVSMYFPGALAAIGNLLPTGVANFFSSVGGLVSNAFSYIKSIAFTFGGKAIDAFKAADFSTQAAVVVGAASIIAPEATGAIIKGALENVGSVAGDVLSGAGSAISSIFSSPLGIAAIGIGAYLLFFSNNDSKEST